VSAIAVIAKAPAPGRSKTRLCPPCTPAQAALLAEAALADTLAAAARTRVERRVLVLDDPARAFAAPPGFQLVRQRGEGLAQRLANAFDEIGGPLLLIGMDTPQVTAALLERGLELLAPGRAVLGAALDGGYWAIGLHAADPGVFAGVPMSAAETCAHQRRRLAERGLAVDELPALRDVDVISDARAVAETAPHGRFAATLRALPVAVSSAAAASPVPAGAAA